MLFTPDLFMKVLDGTKTQTRRINQRFKVGDVVGIVAEPYNGYKGTIKITHIKHEKINLISGSDIIKEGLATREEFMELWESIYPGCEDAVVYTFGLIKD